MPTRVFKVTAMEVSEKLYRVIFTFEDGHRAIFQGHRFRGLHHFALHKGGADEKPTVLYNGRLHRTGFHSDEHCFVVIADYTPERVANYWQGASDYVRSKLECRRNPFAAGDLELAQQVVIIYGDSELELIKKGLAPLPTR